MTITITTVDDKGNQFVPIVIENPSERFRGHLQVALLLEQKGFNLGLEPIPQPAPSPPESDWMPVASGESKTEITL
jgi:hypothetical protein